MSVFKTDCIRWLKKNYLTIKNPFLIMKKAKFTKEIKDIKKIIFMRK
tara:strand:+ start:8714 stop:8854 length:141 start_codon:yes stop_codon:yes gene_type:complete